MASLTEILNWRIWNDNISLSGQPSEAQLADLASSGVDHIINLAPHSNKGALKDEPGTVKSQGMSYTHIPVDFENPTNDDFDAFCAALSRLNGARVHVHCIYNARVSAFFYRYARAGMGGVPATAYDLMDSIWRPGGVWAEFISDGASVSLPNRYAGDDY